MSVLCSLFFQSKQISKILKGESEREKNKNEKEFVQREEI